MGIPLGCHIICNGKLSGKSKKVHPVICKYDRDACRQKDKGYFYVRTEVEKVQKYDNGRRICRDYKMEKCSFGS